MPLHHYSNMSEEEPSLTELIASAETSIAAGQREEGIRLLKQAVDGVDKSLESIEKFIKPIKDGDNVEKAKSVEILAYASVRSVVKQRLADDAGFLSQLIIYLGASQANPPVIFGGLTILANLTIYQPTLSDEQQRVAQLKNLAEAKETTQKDPRESDQAVASRGSKILEAGFMGLVNSKRSQYTVAASRLLAAILLSLSRDKAHRGKIAQGGGIAYLASVFPIYNEEALDAKIDSAHALARLLISINSEIYFKHSMLSLTSVIKPLAFLLDSGTLLAKFEALMALTNIASIGEESCSLILKDSWPVVEGLLLADNILVRRASMELLCNMVHGPETIELFLPSSASAGNRTHILLALADVEDVQTRQAAGGALAVLTEYPDVIKAVISRHSGVDILIDMALDSDIGLKTRGLFCLNNLVHATGSTGELVLKTVHDSSRYAALKAAFETLTDEQCKQLGEQISQKLDP